VAFQHDARRTGQSQFDTSANIGAIKWVTSGDGVLQLVASSAALATDGTIYVGGNGLYAINPDGSQKWEFGNSVVSSPAVGADGTIYSGDLSGKLNAINPDGSAKWSFGRGGCFPGDASMIISSPAVGADGTIYVGSACKAPFGAGNFDSRGNFYAINPDGSQKWVLPADFSVLSSPALGADGTIYEELDIGGVRGIYAINPDGSQKWASSVVGGSPAVGADGTIYTSAGGVGLEFAPPSPAVVGSDGTIFIAGTGVTATNPDGTLKWVFTSAPSYSVYAINPDGTLKWQFDAGNYMESAPAVGVDGTIYIGTNTGQFFALGPYLAPSPANVAFGNQPVRVTSPPTAVTLANYQAPGLSISNIAASGDFTVSSSTCGNSLAPGKSCRILVTFRPTARGTRTGMLTVNDSASSSPQTTNLSGIGTVVLALSPSSLSFTVQPAGIASFPKALALLNTAAVPVAISSIKASGDFAVSSTTCASSLGPLASCAISVTFKPTASGTRVGQLTVNRQR
jgi:hypothetical protein